MVRRVALARTVAVALGLSLAALTGTVDAADGQKESRASVLARSQVWLPTDIPAMNLAIGPTGPGSFEPGATISCDYVATELGGASPKFACLLPDGDELKVKYGGTNGEVYGEVAASRLLWALGFGADRMYSVRVICRGCPERIAGIRRENGDLIVDPVAVERKSGRELFGRWAWRELDTTDAEAGGATTAERDALKLLAVLLQHTDSKPQQQRVVCLDEPQRKESRCETPLMMINDLGLTFGTSNRFNTQPGASVHLKGWSAVPVWKDAGRCVGNLPGSATSTLRDPVISEEGRQFLADLLVQLSDEQLRDMFAAARVYLRPRDPANGRSGFPEIDEWVVAFKAKRAQIVDHSCPAPGAARAGR